MKELLIEAADSRLTPIRESRNSDLSTKVAQQKKPSVPTYFKALQDSTTWHLLYDQSPLAWIISTFDHWMIKSQIPSGIRSAAKICKALHRLIIHISGKVKIHL